MSRQRYPWGELIPLHLTENHRLVVIPPERREYSHSVGGGEDTHPTARQYEVHRYGSRVGTLSKERHRGYGCPGWYEWHFFEDGGDRDLDSWQSLAEAKRALNVTGVRQEATR